MPILTPSKLIAFLAILACASGAANAQKWPSDAEECQWFGTAPLCDGECPAGWRIENYSGAGCVGTWGISGTKAFCCRIKAPCGPAQYGTPGCPYPSFGGCKPGETQGTILGKKVCCPPGQEFVAHVGCREPEPKETQPIPVDPTDKLGIKDRPKPVNPLDKKGVFEQKPHKGIGDILKETKP